MSHYYEKKQTSPLNLQKISALILGNNIELYTGSGVFSKSGVDRGSILLANKAIIQDKWKVLDFGCGYGAIGIAVAKAYPSAKVLLSDINKRAVGLAKKNIGLNSVKNASAIQSDLFEKINEKFNTILLNPPQSAGKELCIKMIEQSKEHLEKNGLFQMVARHNIGGRELEKNIIRIFGNVKEIAKKSGFRIYVSENR
jgi:16S rRNA G1207 methylase RsmC